VILHQVQVNLQVIPLRMHQHQNPIRPHRQVAKICQAGAVGLDQVQMIRSSDEFGKPVTISLNVLTVVIQIIHDFYAALSF
jgi:hypothetical protein